MPTKAYPFNAEKLTEVVIEGTGLMHDNKLVPHMHFNCGIT
jgi:hypothetical protein